MLRRIALLLLLAACEKTEDARPAPAPAPVAPVDGVTTIELPPVKATPVDDERPKLIVAITRDGTVHVGDQVVTDVAQALADVRRNGFTEIYIDADQDAAYSAVVSVMAAAKAAGITKVQLITDRDRALPVPLPRRPPRGP